MIISIIKEYIKNFFSNKCLICKKDCGNNILCNYHFSKIHFIKDPKCYICSYPFEHNYGVVKKENLICSKCLSQKKRYFNKINVIVKYNDIVKKIIISFKYYNKIFLGKYIADILYNYNEFDLNKIDYISSIPSYKNKFLSKKYNHSFLITYLFYKKIKKKHKNIKFIPDLISKTKNNKNQASLNYNQRYDNVKNIFKLNNKYKYFFNNENILIIDDVITTGNTINEYCRILSKYNKNININLLIFAKKII